ncbi:D-alanyl-D-alanine carboxypeptidase [Streptomyces sviceus]|uniref:D-alanyl-D-alanine carboxypeptidase n=1 Tax=Streptomyces sviceus TaxID=285530 RepID=UPI0036AC1789
MEEASVAGESPDRSKQRESSAEPTSGSASPVPEARSSAPDPRLAVARESISLGGVDTATRVFSVRDLPKASESPAEAGTAGSGPGEPEDAPSATEEHPEAAEEASPAEESKDEGSAVTPEDSDTAETSDGSGTGEGSDDSGTAEGSDDSGTGEGSGESSAAETPEDTGTANAPDDSGTADDSHDTATAEGSEDSGTADPGTAEGSGDSGAGEGSGTAKGPGSGAADTPEDTSPAKTPEDSGTAKTPDDPDTTEDSHDTATAVGSEDSGTAETPGDSGAAETPEVADTATAEGPEESEAAEGSDGSGTAKAPEDSRTAESPDAPDATDPADGSRDSGAAGSSDSAAGGGDARLRDAVAAWVATADGDGSGKGAEDESSPATDTDTDTAGEGGESATARPAPDEPADAPPVDQPTAVFKAPRPAVDQPTTMLKLGKAPEAEQKPEPKPEPKPEAEPKPAPKPEADAERTSRFVALKALDEPRPKADLTAAVPQVGPERTTQQPLPPKPPLDLLAELTNTPPPPPSPLRTLGRRVKIWTPILILLVVAFAIAQSLRPLPNPTLSLTAEDSYTFDGSRATLPWPTQGQGWMDVNGIGTMGDFGKQTPVAIGSVAKAMTAYIVLKDHPLKSGEEGAKITVDALAEKEGGYNKQGESTLNTVKNGDVLTQRQAIAAIMIPSANNIARLLARWDSGSEAAFIKKMNDTAKELGMKNTTYTDASGLKETTVSTAEDQVKLGNELVKIPALMEITSMGQWIDPSGQKWYNYNYLVPYTGIGIKTGTTSAAGGNLLFAARKKVGGETVTVVGAILGQHKAPIIKTVNDVSKVALLAAEDALKSAKILKKGDVVGYVDDGLGGHTPVVLTKDVTAVGWAGFKVKLSFAADDVPHTAKAGTKVGSLTVGDGEGGAVKVPVTLQKDLTEPGFTDKLTRVG